MRLYEDNNYNSFNSNCCLYGIASYFWNNIVRKINYAN